MIPQRYTEGVAVLIGGGPSLTAQQVSLCMNPHQQRRLAVMGCNDAYRICPFLDVLYAADERWIDYHQQNVLKSAHLRTLECWTPDEKAAEKYSEWSLIGIKPIEPGLSTDRAVLHGGNHSGYQLINLAYLMGCLDIILIGYDGHSGGDHWFGKHPEGPMNIKSNYQRWMAGYRSIQKQAAALNLTIVNATPGSAIDAFPHATLDDALYGLRRRYGDGSG